MSERLIWMVAASLFLLVGLLSEDRSSITNALICVALARLAQD